jgi:hypothetical protein
LEGNLLEENRKNIFSTKKISEHCKPKHEKKLPYLENTLGTNIQKLIGGRTSQQSSGYPIKNRSLLVVSQPSVSGIALTVPAPPSFDIITVGEVREKSQRRWNSCAERMAGNGVFSRKAEVGKEVGQNAVELARSQVFSRSEAKAWKVRAVCASLLLQLKHPPQAGHWAAVKTQEGEKIQEFSLNFT